MLPQDTCTSLQWLQEKGKLCDEDPESDYASVLYWLHERCERLHGSGGESRCPGADEVAAPATP